MAARNKTEVAFCYPHAGTVISARWLDRSTDAAEDGEWIEGETELEKMTSPPAANLSIEVEASIDRAAVAGTIAEGEDPLECLEMVLLITGSNARRRESVGLTPVPADDSSLSFTGTWKAERRAIAGDVTLTPSLVRSVEGSDRAFAAYPGEELAGCLESLTLKVDEQTSNVMGDIDVRWVDFPSDRPDDVGNAWIIEAESSREPPKLFLDSSIKDFQETLNNETKGSSAIHRRRDLLEATIASEVWTSLAASALSNLARDVGDDDEGLAVSEDDWRRRLLGDVAGHLYEDMPVDEGISTLLQEHRDNPVQLSAKIAKAAQRRNGLRKALQAVVELPE